MDISIKPLIESIARRRAAYALPLTLFVGVFALAAPAWAQSNKSGSWPTTKWVVTEGAADEVPHGMGGLEFAADLVRRLDERYEIAEKHREVLEAAGPWYQGLGFPPPRQWTEDRNLQVAPGEAYLGFLKESPESKFSYHDSDGEMWLTSNRGFLVENDPMWQLLKASAVHELYHAIQRGMTRSLDAAARDPDRIELPVCQRYGSTHVPSDLSWITEGTAAMVQIRWLEHQSGVRWGHPFKGSRRPTWIRQFDQSLPLGRLSMEQKKPTERSDLTSWSCDYGTWYFWYAVGEMIGRNDEEKVAYTRYLYNGPRSWSIGGIGAVDLALRRAAEEYDAIGPYRDGLYDLYPQFVAQYLTEDDFYGNLQTVELGAPDLYETRSLSDGGVLGMLDPRGPIEPLATRAWRFRIRLPDNESASSIPYNVRFTLDALDGSDLDALHLIVDDKVFTQHPDSTVPYAAVMRTDRADRAAGGAVEYLVRVANVAEDAAETDDAGFSLRVEVDGFYGNDVSGGLSADDIGRIAGELPPGFSVRGPGPWTCNGNERSRAVFDLVTPDELGRDVDRLLPGLASSTQSQLDNVAIMLKRMESAGVPTGGMTQEQLALIRKKADGALAAARPMIQPKADVAADKVRSGRTSTVAATFVGRNGGAECQMILGATLAGREGGAQILPRSVNEGRTSEDPAPSFDVGVYSAKALQAMRTLRPGPDPLDGWQACSMNDTEREGARQRAATGDCPVVTCTPGRLTLEAAEQGRIAGTFQFEVVRWGERGSGQCRKLLGRDNVTGHFNVHSTDDGKDDNSLGGLGVGSSITPGAPIL